MIGIDPGWPAKAMFSLMIPGNRLAVGRVHDEAATLPAASDPVQVLV
jgi:hypothetical protein